MKAFSASILLSGGRANATSTASFSSSGLAGVLVVVFRSVDRASVVELSARSSVVLFAAPGEACATGLSTGVGVFATTDAGLSAVCGGVPGDGVDGMATGGVETAGVSKVELAATLRPLE